MSLKISKAALARKLGVSKAAVSRYISLGMPITMDGCVDPDLAAAWVKDNIRVQSGSRGRGVRGAVRFRGAGGRNGHDSENEALREHTRLMRLRADKLAAELDRLKGGTQSERAQRLAETIALQCWWCFQRAGPSALARVLAMKVGRGDDKQLMYLLTDAIRVRDEIVMRDILHELRDGFAGMIEPRDNPLVGAPWLEGRRASSQG